MDREYTDQTQEIDIKEMIHILKTKWWVIAITLAVALLGATIYSYVFLEDIYESKALLFVGKEAGVVADRQDLSLSEIQLYERLVSDYQEIVKSRLAAREVLELLGKSQEMSVSRVQRGIDVSIVRGSRMFTISYRDPDPSLATSVVNAMSVVIIEQAARIVEVENVRVVDPAEVPYDPVSPNRPLNVMIGAVLGLMLGVGLVFAMEFFSNTIKNPADVERYLGLNTMGEIPDFEGEKRGYHGKSKKRKKSKKPVSDQ